MCGDRRLSCASAAYAAGMCAFRARSRDRRQARLRHIGCNSRVPDERFSNGRSRADSMSALIELEHVSKIYASGEMEVRALDDVSLAISTGQFVAVMGASGSGKSTLMNVIGCLDRPTRGVYRL